MITHVVCWKYKPDVSPDQRLSHVEQLRKLPDFIANIESFSVGFDILHLDRSFDTALVAVYRDRSALDDYTNHPEHVKVAAFGKEIAEKVVSVDFESE